MAYKRKRSAAPTRRRVRPRMSRVSRGVRGGADFVLKRKVYIGQLGFSPASTTGFWRYLTTNVADMPSYGEYTSIFDEYKITGLKMEFRPQFNSFDNDDLPSANFLAMGSFHTAVDTQSHTVPSGTFNNTTLNVFLEQAKNIKTWKQSQVASVFLRPSVSRQIAGGTLTGTNIPAPWIKTNQTLVDHYGVHTFMQPFSVNGSALMFYDYFITYYVKFRGSR